MPPRGGAPKVWFQNAAIDGAFGPNRVRVDKKSEKLTSPSLSTPGNFHVYVNDKAGKLHDPK